MGATLSTPTDASGGEHDPTPTKLCLNCVPQDETESGRDGRKMSMKYISVFGLISTAPLANETDLSEQAHAVISLVMDTQTNGAQLASENVFVNPSANAAGVVSHFRNLQYIERFKVLKTIHIALPIPSASSDAAGSYDTQGTSVRFSMNVPLNDIQVNFTSTTEAIANIVDNSLHIIAYSLDTGSPAVKLTYNARLRFVG